MGDGETADYIQLLSIEPLSEKKLLVLLDRFRTPASIMNAARSELAESVGSDLAGMIAALERDDGIKRKIDLAEKLNIRVEPYYAASYPAWLRQIDNFPPVLFVRGTVLPGDEQSIAIVGTRGATVYGKSIAEDFAREFVKSGLTVISGMARGIDTAAHQSAVRHGGRTIAVLGCGLDRPYPPENGRLLEAIEEHGAAISEFNVGTPPRAQNFPKRNRIISGLARAIVAIEAKEKSGVMNTVNWATQQNKDVFAIPGNIYAKTSSGTNRLIKDGAIPVTAAGEILDILHVRRAGSDRSERAVHLENEEKTVWDALTADPVFLDELAERTSIATPMLLQALLALEMKELVIQLPGMKFVRRPDGR